MICYKNIHLSFQEELVQEGRIDIENEQMTLLSGESGTGKSSLLYDIVMLSHQSQGTYLLDKQDMTHISTKQKETIQKELFAFVPQTLFLFPHLNLLENIKTYALMNHQTFNEELARRYLDDLHLNLDSQTSISVLSGGEKQRLMIVCALMKDTPYLFMDEPTAYLDNENKKQLIQILQLLRDEYHKTIFITSHDPMIEKICDAHYRIENKKIVCLKQAKGKKSISCTNNHGFNFYEFIKEKRSKERNRVMLIQILLFLILFVSSLFVTLRFHYQNNIEKQLESLSSTQIVIDVKQEVTGEMIHQIDRGENITKVMPLYPLITDDNIQIMPYFSTDDFQKVSVHHQQNNGIYINNDAYQYFQHHLAYVPFNNQLIDLSQADVLLDDCTSYQYQSDIRKCIYVPYTMYQDIVQPSPTSLLILKIDHKNHYKKTIQSLSWQYPNLKIVDKPNVLYMLHLQEIVEKFSSIITVAMYLFMLCVFIVVKMIDDYQSRKSEVILEMNGLSHRQYTFYFMLEEMKRILLVAFLSFLCVLFVLYFLQIHEFFILIMTLLFGSLILWILFVIIYLIMNCIYTPIQMIKAN